MGKISPTYNQIIKEIEDLCSTDKEFQERTNNLISFIGNLNEEKLVYYLKNSGAIPEDYKHDSAEEKLYAKFLDILVYGFFCIMGMKTILCKERADYADVIGETKDYIIVADAKGFRLSRTALNPKDYKIEALNRWRLKAKGNFAMLVAPINEFPKGKSRLYEEAIKYNILMISYSHLIFILKHKEKIKDFETLLNTNSLFKENIKIQAEEYWDKINKIMIDVCSGKENLWETMKNEAKKDTLSLIEEQIEHLNKIAENIKNMSEIKVKELLLDKLGIKNKLEQINRKKRFLEGGLLEEE